MSNVQDNAAHTCSYSCDRPECIKAQRDELAAAAAQEAVAYLDIGAGGYLDIGSDLPEEQLLALPNGRHALGIIGTYGIDGYVSAPVTAAPVDLDALAVNRYRPVPDGLLAYKVVAGDGTRSLFSGTMNECNVVARKLTEAFLDGAHVASTPAAPRIDRGDLLSIIDWWNAYTGPVDEALGEVIQRIRALIDASPKGATLNEQFGSAEGLDSPKGGSEAKDAARYRHLQKVTPFRFKKLRDTAVTDAVDVLYFHADRFDAALDAHMQATSAEVGV